MVLRALLVLLTVLIIGTLPAAAEVVLVRGNAGGDPSSLDPHQTQGTWENNIVGDMMLGLTTEDANGKIVPGAATSWDVSPDGLTWTFHMRKGAVWSDGTPVTADDFVYSWRRLLDPATAAQYAAILYVVKNAEAINSNTMPVDQLGAAAPDHDTLVVTLEHPAPYFFGIAAHQATFPVPSWVIEKYGRDWDKPGHYVSNGPYTLVDWRVQDAVELVKNPTFWDADNVKIDRVFWKPVTDVPSGLKRFRAGELDTYDNWPIADKDRLKRIMPTEQRIAPFLALSYLVFNTQRKPFDDVRVREALSLAYNRDTVTNRIYGIGEKIACSIVPPGTENYSGGAISPDCKMKDQIERLQKARALMAEAGYGPDHPLRFRFSVRVDNDVRRAAAAALQMWEQIGVQAQLNSVEPRVFYTAVLQAHDFDVADASWVGDFNDPETFLFMFETSNKGFNYGSWSNPEYDALMAQERLEPDAAKRSAIMEQAEQIALDNYAVAPTRFPYSRHLIQTYVDGWHANLRDVYRTRWLSIEGPKIPPAAAVASAQSGNSVATVAQDRPWYAFLTDIWTWFLSLLCSWFGVACPAG